MALKDPRILFGVHSFTPYSRTDGKPFGTIRVIGSSSISFSGELVKLNGGSNRYPWAIEDGLISAEISLKVKEVPNFIFELFGGRQPTQNAAEASGSANGFANVSGTSVLDASTGIATVTVATASDLKFGRYIIEAVSATTVDVYLASNVDILRGTDADYVDDTLKITATPLTVVASSSVAVPDFGFQLDGGAGVIGMTVGDTAQVDVRPPNSESMEVSIGGETDEFPEFGAISLAQKRSNGEMFEVELFRVKGIGLPIGMEEKTFAEPEITAEAFTDSVKGVAKFTHVFPT